MRISFTLRALGIVLGLGAGAVLAPLHTRAQQLNLSYLWAKSGGGVADDTGRGVAVDQVGNVYVTGRFIGTSPFGTDTLEGTGASQDIFLVKYNAQGVVQWAKNAGGTGDDSGIGVAVNAAGEVYVTGYFNAACSFGMGTPTLTSYGSYDIFLAKYSPAGALLWARNAGGTSNDEGQGLSVTPQGDVAVVGFFGDSLTIGSGTPLAVSGRRACLIRYNDQGVPQWSRLVGDSSGTYARGASFDAAGNVYVTGNTVESGGNNDGFLTKVNAAGTIVWTRFVGGTGFDRSIGVAADGYGGVLIAGLFDATASFGPVTIASSGDYDSFLAKYDAAGNFAWVRTAGGSGRDYAMNLALDQYGNPLITGLFTGSATFGATVLTGGSSSLTNVFRAWYDWQGNVLGAEAAGSTEGAIGYGVAVDNAGDTYLTGSFSGIVVLAPLTLVNANPGGTLDAFVGKIGSSQTRLHPPRALGLAVEPLPASVDLYPNPATSGGRIQLPLHSGAGSSTLVRLYDAQGRLVQQTEVLNESHQTATDLTLGYHTPGLYLVRLTTGGRNQTARLVIH